MAQTITVIWTMPMTSLNCRDGPVLHHRRDRITLAYDFPISSGEFIWESVLFLGVAALEFTPRTACTREQMAACDRLVELDGSGWQSTVRDALSNRTSLRHFRIAFEPLGCYDVLALDYVPPPAGPPRLLSPWLVAQGRRSAGASAASLQHGR